jgi:hypothetical protein
MTPGIQLVQPTVSTLTLLVPGVVANHEHHAPTTYDLAVFTNSLDAGADFHGDTQTRELPWVQSA